jgi:hypothetical protein
LNTRIIGQDSRVAWSASDEESNWDRRDLVQPLTEVRVRHRQVHQRAVLRTRCTRHAQGAGVSGTDGALGLRPCSDLSHLESSEKTLALRVSAR